MKIHKKHIGKTVVVHKDKPSESISQIEKCLNDICAWMRSNLLICNDDKTEVIHFLFRLKKNYEKLTPWRVGGSDIIITNCIREHGSFLWQQVMYQHILIMSVKFNLMHCTVSVNFAFV